MADSAYVIEVTQDNFHPVVVEGSREVPVLVDFWAEWCGPCQMQLPVLLRLAEGYAGGFILAKVNTELEQELALQHGIRSIPTMKLYVGGQVVEEIQGAQPESALRALLDRHVARASDQVRSHARALRDAGDLEAAIDALRVANADDPDNLRVTLDLIDTLVAAGRLDEADACLRSLPLDQRTEAEYAEAGLLLARLARGEDPEAAPGGDPALDQAVVDAARLALDDAVDASLEAWLALITRRPGYRAQVGRRGMLALFARLGDGDPRVKTYRNRMFRALY